MTSRRLPFLFAVCVVLLVSGMRSMAVAASKPNIVMLISDDQSWTDFGFMGHKTISTPHLDKLASQSLTFPRGYVPTSLCRPSLATMITGLYPYQHKITGNDPPRGINRMEMLKHINRLPTLAKLLGKQGYVSHQSGKWWEGNHKLGGFTAGMTHGDPKRRGRHGDLGLKIGRTGMKPIFDFIDSAGDKPFLLWYAPFLPHTPHTPPERLLKKYQKPGRPLRLAKYYAMCEWFDETCGQLLDHLDEKKLADNTLVVFVTDNGWIQRTPQTKVPPGWRFRFAPKSKRSPNEGGIRTPIMVRWPGKVKPRISQALVSSIDLAPTILAAAGLKPTAAMQGINLLDVAKNDGKSERKTIFGDIYAHDVADIDVPSKSLKYRWCIHKNWKIIVPASAPSGTGEPTQLYDLAQDPHETNDLAKTKPDVLAAMVKRLDAWWPGKP